MTNQVDLFYAVPEFLPPWRLDVGHLFGEQLRGRGVAVTWSMWRQEAGPCAQTTWQGQAVFVPRSFGRDGLGRRMLTRIARAVCEMPLFFRLLFGRRYAVIQARDVRYLFALLGWLAARLRGAKFVYWLSYPFPEHYLDWAARSRGPGRLARMLEGRLTFWFLYRWLLHRADHVFVQSEQMKKDVASYGVPEAKMTPVPMGVPPRLLEWTRSNAVAVVPGRIVYVGTLARVRRLETIVEAFAAVAAARPDATLVIVGDGDLPGERAFLETEARRLRVADRVLFTGFVPMEEAWRYAASAAVCLSPFYPTFVLRSTSPTKINEYLALGRPVVANDHPEQSAALAESGAGYCVEWDGARFAAAILKLLDDPAAAEAMGARGPAWVAAHRTYDRIADGVMDKYLEIAGTGP